MKHFIFVTIFVTLLFSGSAFAANELGWPVECTPGDSSCYDVEYYPEHGSGPYQYYDCSSSTYTGTSRPHEGTDISLRSFAVMDAGVDVLAAAAGTVVYVSDSDSNDRCTTGNCGSPLTWNDPDGYNGYWVQFYGGNVIVIRHKGSPGAGELYTRYDHLKYGSTVVNVGDTVTEGQKIAEVGSAGYSTGPHLHFEVWQGGLYVLNGNHVIDPWVGSCGDVSSQASSPWKYNPPYAGGGEIPTVGEWGMIILSLLLAISVYMYGRKRRLIV